MPEMSAQTVATDDLRESPVTIQGQPHVEQMDLKSTTDSCNTSFTVHLLRSFSYFPYCQLSPIYLVISRAAFLHTRKSTPNQTNL